MSDATLLNFKRDCRSLCALASASVSQLDWPGRLGACKQFRVIADYLNIDKDDREWATYPKRAVAVTLPVHMDDGSTKAFQGYRVQHHIALGPTKGGTRFAPSLSMGETAALAMWMSWKCAL